MDGSCLSAFSYACPLPEMLTLLHSKNPTMECFMYHSICIIVLPCRSSVNSKPDLGFQIISVKRICILYIAVQSKDLDSEFTCLDGPFLWKLSQILAYLVDGLHDSCR